MYIKHLFLDLYKAFDNVNHEMLSNKLNYYGIRGLPLEWFKSYQTNRKQCIAIISSASSKQNIKYGVPQGSILGLRYYFAICQ